MVKGCNSAPEISSRASPTCESISTVKVELRGGGVMTSAITREAAEDLELAIGAEVTVLVKATEVTPVVAD